MNNFDTLGMFGEIAKRWTAIASEMTDYTKRSWDESSAVFAKLASAKSVEDAFGLQAEYVKHAYDAHLKEMAKISSMCAGLAQNGLAQPK